MNISPTDLKAEFLRGWSEYPAVHHAARKYNLPPRLIWAVASRETNVQNENGDGGHGRGIFQLDDRYHVIPDPFPVHEQAETAARELADLLRWSKGDIAMAAAAYNAGTGNVQKALNAHLPADYYTTGRDYGADVVERMHYLRTVAHPKPVTPAKKAPAKKAPAKKAPAKKAPAKKAGK